ncbi:MAG: methylenetetrahydrofolate--tRNA-(uracil(54)-C(5))-methyltransferase (FADH(2)-oxidizing) TrmFO [Synergistaceae bacterium]|nr:methylenetetrahydrofolate--tRNA-(uracil(54)-C(5))-methyltransferase (FADH(2)-oxidizing) TrmFO [Synergistaceae bacterium]MBQ3448752.1 methylenetetrahydrofolate--tRNA-(uracil(54)-C(5))-methyltransferase (FADH(2)-oxidizing) TrmFO [Synergistaceae bacterium]MBQ6111957.1 methylenetetrahydrofolate--tRNA-(uracil(54)-C(5))-methyltransferase (FADH(2)-oxidizing) TrmFO [Synergistaceae bacterium]MBQ9628099.1 methylenetetrahydrofolate--tRNA-(uracil(54)-C(5))-methyltransferase (FADH(2)-oxidizing) TrmFO [Syn
MSSITIIGGGLAGCEAAYQLSKRGCEVSLYEMRPNLLTPAHKTGMLAEIVCSNSLGSENINERITASGILKEELELSDSLILSCAKESRVPAGGALAVDREKFSGLVTQRIESCANIHIIREEYTHLPEELAIISSGPLTSDSLAEAMKEIAGERIYFYDAVAPVIMRESIDMSKVFVSGRYGRGDDYINCPMNKEEYLRFHDALVHAERNLPHDFERDKYFEGCMPVEAIAERGTNTLRFGPMKPRGLIDPKTNREPYAAVQLRQDNFDGTLYNLVGFQTGLKWPEQKRVFSMIPGLENAEFVRLGVMHRNTSVNAPAVLDEWLRLKERKNIFLAGQITGVEGYMESTAMGLAAGINASMILEGKDLISWPRDSAVGSLIHYLMTTEPSHFQPMNINLGLFPELVNVRGKKERAKIHRDIAIESLKAFLNAL